MTAHHAFRPVASQALSRPLSVNTPAHSGKSAKIIRPGFKPDRAISSINATSYAARLIAATFPARSENEMCDMAAAALGCNASTIRRIARAETKNASFNLIGRLFFFAASRGVDPLELAGFKEAYHALYPPKEGGQ